MGRAWTTGCGVAAWLLAVSPTAARAQSDDGQPAASISDEARAEAQRHFEAGTAAYQAGDYDRAMAEFDQAHELTGHPDLLFNIYTAAERAGQLEHARDALAAHLRDAEVDPAERPDLEERLVRLDARIEQARAEEEAAEAARREELEEAARAAQQNAPSAAPPEPDGVHPAGPVLLGVGGAGLVAFAIFAGLSQAEADRLSGGCGASRTCLDGDVGELSAFNLAADISWISGAVIAVTGLVLLFALPPESSDPPAEAVVAPWVAPSPTGAVAAGVTVGGTL